MTKYREWEPFFYSNNLNLITTKNNGLIKVSFKVRDQNIMVQYSQMQNSGGGLIITVPYCLTFRNRPT